MSTERKNDQEIYEIIKKQSEQIKVLVEENRQIQSELKQVKSKFEERIDSLKYEHLQLKQDFDSINQKLQMFAREDYVSKSPINKADFKNKVSLDNLGNLT